VAGSRLLYDPLPDWTNSAGFEYLNNFTQALECYRSATLWKEGLFCAAHIPLSTEQIQETAREFLESMRETKQYASCASLQLDYLQDIEGAIGSYCKGFLFSDALRIAGLYPTHIQYLESIDKGLSEGLATLLELFADCKLQVSSQVPRLRDLRAKKAEDEMAYYEGTGDTDLPDNISVAASGVSTSASLFTRYTNRDGTIRSNSTHKTSKNVRREERKRARGKKGSIYEEEYLVNSLERLVDRINATHGDFESLVQTLVRRRMLEQARAVTKSLAELIELLESVKEEVFSSEVEAEPTQAVLERPAGPMGVVHDMLEGRSKKKDIVIKQLGQQIAEMDI
jgi:elongator complex protein 1